MRMRPDKKEQPPLEANGNARLAVSLGTLSILLDAHRSSVRRWLRAAGVKPIVCGSGRKGAIRYRWDDIQAWLDSRDRIK